MLGEGGRLFCYINKRIKTEKEEAHCIWHGTKTNRSMVSSRTECFVWVTNKCDNEDVYYNRMTKENEDMETNFASKPRAQCTHRCVSTHRERAEVTTLELWKIQRLKLLVQLYIFLKSSTGRYQQENSRHRTFISEGGWKGKSQETMESYLHARIYNRSQNKG